LLAEKRKNRGISDRLKKRGVVMRYSSCKKMNGSMDQEKMEREKGDWRMIQKITMAITIMTLLLTSLGIAVKKPEMVLIPSRTFQIGEKKKPGSYPVHQVTITNDFYMGKYEITNKEFVAFLNDVNAEAWKRDKRVEAYYQGVQLYSDYGDYPSHETIHSGISHNGRWFVKTAYTDAHDRQWNIDYSSLPVVYVTWYGAVEYCNWLSRKEGLKEAYTKDLEVKTYHLNDFPNTEGYRLPTEAEWEYAASDGGNHKWAGTSSKEELGKYASYNENAKTYGVHMAQEVGSRLPNGFGLYDMSGNVWEWCTDNAYKFTKESKTDPLYVNGENTDNKHRVCKGGGFSRRDDVCRVSWKNYWLWYNDFYAVNNCHDDELGFRIVRTKRHSNSLRVSKKPILRSLYMVDWNGNSQAIFDENDSGVAFCFHFDNWEGLHEIRGNWYYPNGELYNEGTPFEYEQSDFENCSKHWIGYEFAEKDCALTAMKNHPGEWKIEIFLDGEYLGLLYFEFEVMSNRQKKSNEVFVTGGSFYMGNTRNDSEANWDEEPVQKVTITYSYFIGKYETTFKEFDEFCINTGKQLKNDKGWGRGDRPVINVSWYDAIEYCNWLSLKSGLQPAYDQFGNLLNKYGNITEDITMVEGYRLPTEAEWEFAARGGNESTYDYKYSGSNHLDDVGWYKQNSNNQTHPVGQKKPNELGLYDMSGNVWEWCCGSYIAYSKKESTNPVKCDDINRKFDRGGSFYQDNHLSRVSRRGAYHHYKNYYGYWLGFRIARTAFSY